MNIQKNSIFTELIQERNLTRAIYVEPLMLRGKKTNKNLALRFTQLKTFKLNFYRKFNISEKRTSAITGGSTKTRDQQRIQTHNHGNIACLS